MAPALSYPYHQSRLRVALDSFSSAWFLVPQGTGILAVILHQLDYQFRGLDTISVILWVINFSLLFLFTLIYLARFAFQPRAVIRAVLTNTTEAACLASISVAFTPAIQMMALVVVQSWGGHAWGMAAYVLWWINTFMALVAVLGLPMVFVHSIHKQGGYINSLTPATQLPLIAALTSAAGAGTLCQAAMLSQAQKIPMIIVSYLEIGLALPLAVVLDILFLARVLSPWDTETGAEPLVGAQVYSEMVLCGPWGQSSFAFQSLGTAMFNLQKTLGQYPAATGAMLLSSQAAGPIGVGSMFMGLLAWGHGTFWWLFAIVSIVRSSLSRLRNGSSLPFAIPTWALVFPWGVYTNSAVQLGKLLDSPAFKVWSTVLAVMLVIIWLVCMAFTIRGVLLGTLLGQQRGWKRSRPIHSDEQSGSGR